VPHHRDVREIECVDHGGEVVGVPVHVVSGPGLTRSTMPTTIVGHDPEAVLCEEQHLAVPHVGVQRPPMRQGDDRAVAPVFVVDRRAVLRRDRAHVCISSVILPRAFIKTEHYVVT
jgi:hypothetical protein